MEGRMTMYCVGESMVIISPADSDLRVVVQLLSIRLHIVKLVIAAFDFIVTLAAGNRRDGRNC